MKTLLVILSFCTVISLHTQTYPVLSSHSSSGRFVELNMGVALASLVLENDRSNFPFPGFSFLWGKTINYDNNIILEYEGGISLPSIVTGKVGIGKKYNNSTFVAGIRPFPANFYIQTSFAHKEKGYWILSLEYNPFESDNLIAFGSKSLFTIGYRWHRPRKKNLQ